MSSKEHESDHMQLQYVNKKEMRVAIGPSHSDNWNSQKEKAKSKLSRRKATLTRHINVAERLLKSYGCKRKLREQAGKIEGALTELERPSKENESCLELEGLQEHLELTEKAIERANLCLENIEISEAGIIYPEDIETVCETLKIPKLKLFTATLNPKLWKMLTRVKITTTCKK